MKGLKSAQGQLQEELSERGQESLELAQALKRSESELEMQSEKLLNTQVPVSDPITLLCPLI